jgi:hypothetical protein
VCIGETGKRSLRNLGQGGRGSTDAKTSSTSAGTWRPSPDVSYGVDQPARRSHGGGWLLGMWSQIRMASRPARNQALNDDGPRFGHAVLCCAVLCCANLVVLFKITIGAMVISSTA